MYLFFHDYSFFFLISPYFETHYPTIGYHFQTEDQDLFVNHKINLVEL